MQANFGSLTYRFLSKLSIGLRWSNGFFKQLLMHLFSYLRKLVSSASGYAQKLEKLRIAKLATSVLVWYRKT